MANSEFVSFFLQISIMLILALVCGQAMRRIKQPVVFGELLGGILLGPTVFGALLPEVYAFLFDSTKTVEIAREAVIQLGMLFFLFVAGLEVNLAFLRRHRLSVSLTGSLGILVPFSLGFALVFVFPEMFNTSAKSSLLLPLFIGTALSISALPVIARILIDLDFIRKDIGQIIMAAATINDLIGWSLFAVILRSSSHGNHLDAQIWHIVLILAGFIILVWIARRWVGQIILRRWKMRLMGPGRIIGIMAILALLAAAAAEAVGLHAIFGAFILGVALAPFFGKRNRAHDIIYQFAMSFFAPIYFVSIGLKTNFVKNFDFSLIIIILIVAFIGKVIGAGLGARLTGRNLRESLAIGFGMNARGAIEMILASIALENKLIDARLFVALIIMALITSLASGPAMQKLIKTKPPEPPLSPSRLK